MLPLQYSWAADCVVSAQLQGCMNKFVVVVKPTGPLLAEWSSMIGLSIVDLSYNNLTGLLLYKRLQNLNMHL